MCFPGLPAVLALWSPVPPVPPVEAGAGRFLRTVPGQTEGAHNTISALFCSPPQSALLAAPLWRPGLRVGLQVWQSINGTNWNMQAQVTRAACAGAIEEALRSIQTLKSLRFIQLAVLLGPIQTVRTTQPLQSAKPSWIVARFHLPRGGPG